MKTIALLVTLFISMSAMAVTMADLSYEVTSRTAQPVTGERVTYDIRVANAGPDAAANVVVTMNHSTIGTALLDLTAPAGWQCDFERYSNSVTCRSASLAAGAAASFVLTAIMPNQPTPLYVGGTVRSDAGELNPSNNLGNVLLAPTPATRKTDLQVLAEDERVVREGSEVVQRAVIRNNGPDEARDVAAVIVLQSFVETPPGSITAAGPGWTCTNTAPLRAHCTRPSLAAGTGAPIDISFEAPAAEARMALFIMPIAELSHDTTVGFDTVAVYVGSRESWRMMLVPIVASNIPGANGSLWVTDLTMVVRADTSVEIRPERCEFSGLPECTDFAPPARMAFDPRITGHVHAFEGITGQYVYVRAGEFHNVSMNSRIHDRSREQQTAGAEIPVPRDTQFTSGINTLMNVPVAPEYRHTLRIYDAEGRRDARVIIRIYGEDGRLRATFERALTTPVDDYGRITNARLPVHPAFLQLQLDQLLDLGGLDSLRVDVEPVGDGVKIWSFLSITNNNTHHVTTVTPQ